MKIRRKILQDIIMIAILAIGINVPILVVEHYQDIHCLKPGDLLDFGQAGIEKLKQTNNK